MLLLIDNLDSFTYNIKSAFVSLGQKVQVIRNHYSEPFHTLGKSEYLVIGPGPGKPSQAGISRAALSFFCGKIPILGICLGHQAIGELFGGKTVKALRPVHGKQSQIFHNQKELFWQMPQGFLATRYHSLIVEKNSFPNVLEISAESAEGEVMAIRHKEMAIYGVQFHPESIATENGRLLLQNFLKQSYCKK